ncbi:MAG TPA: hypothetical protein PLA68_15435 [Panacibacter sp.]|nr:hypothetical protein [Panacibacter sp.]
MRYLIIILLTTLAGSCGNKADSFTYAGKKVVQTVNVCAEAAQRVCNEGSNKPNGGSGNAAKESAEADLKASGGWDTRMMLR